MKIYIHTTEDENGWTSTTYSMSEHLDHFTAYASMESDHAEEFIKFRFSDAFSFDIVHGIKSFGISPDHAVCFFLDYAWKKYHEQPVVTLLK